MIRYLLECVKVLMPAHQVLPLTGYIFEASYITSSMQAKKIQILDQSELLNLWAGIGTLTYWLERSKYLENPFPIH